MEYSSQKSNGRIPIVISYTSLLRVYTLNEAPACWIFVISKRQFFLTLEGSLEILWLHVGRCGGGERADNQHARIPGTRCLPQIDI